MAEISKGGRIEGEHLYREIYLHLYERMLKIRRVEEKIAAVYPEQEIRCPTHLSIGQEASAAGVCAAMAPEDHIYSTHRCHAHYLAKGGDLRAMVAELYGRRNGCAKGKGGSMHLVDPEVGIMGASAIVGGTIPMAAGSALAFQLRGEGRVAAAFFGDAAAEQGAFHESMLFASLRKLPMLFVCENNLYATYSPLSSRQPADNIYERALGYHVPSARVDGNDVLAVYAAAREAVERARGGMGPSLLECRTYRWRDHVGPGFDIQVGYRTQAELDTWMERCPIRRLEGFLRERGVCSEAELEEVEASVTREVEAAFAFAKGSPFPDPSEMHEDVY